MRRGSPSVRNRSAIRSTASGDKGRIGTMVPQLFIDLTRSIYDYMFIYAMSDTTKIFQCLLCGTRFEHPAEDGDAAPPPCPHCRLTWVRAMDDEPVDMSCTSSFG